MKRPIGIFTLALATLAILVAAGITPAGAASSAKERKVTVTVTKNGFEPAKIRLKAGQPVRLVVTRTVERTCATDIVIRQLGIKKPLPLNQPVEVRFTPRAPGEVRYACAMDMIAGSIVVE